MADNSSNKKKTLVVSMLAFLLLGGGVFLFFIIQGSNDLTGAGKSSFHYGGAARESVASFFKSIGVIPDEGAVTQKYQDARMKVRGFLEDGSKAETDVSDWMASTNSGAPSGSGSSPRSAGVSSVPKMSGAAGSGVGGAGGGGSKSAGGVSRFGEDGAAGNTKVSGAKTQSTAGGAGGKGTLGTLKNARAMLGEGLKSDSAMTARSKWGQSFGLGGGGGSKSGELAYGKSGLVNLDKIKSGEIASLKAGVVPEAGAFKRDLDGESKDSNLKDAKDAAEAKSKEDADAAAKKAAAKAMADAVSQGVSQGQGKTDDTSRSGDSGGDPSKKEITDEEKQEAKDLAFFKPEELGGGDTMQDQKVDIVRNNDGGCTYKITGAITPAGGGDPIPYTDTVIRGKDGSLTFVPPKE